MRDCHLSFVSLSLMPASRIPLTRIKSMRENLREKDKLRDYLEKHPYNMAYKFVDSADLDPGVYYEPMRNYLDVSVAGRGQGQGQGWLSREPPRALAKGWRSSGGGSRNAKAGGPAGRDAGKQGRHPQRRRHLNPQLLVYGDQVQPQERLRQKSY